MTDHFAPNPPPAMFKHKQRVSIQRRLMGVTTDGQRGWFDDWTKRGTVRAAKRDLRPMGYWVVQFDDGGGLCIHESQLRAA